MAKDKIVGKVEEVKKKELVINPIFEDIFYDEVDDPRYYQLYGGRGSGKSFVAAVAAVRKAQSKRWRHKILYLRQTMNTLEDSSISDVRTAIVMLGLINDFKEKKGVITHKATGNTISFKGIRSSGSGTAKLKSLSGVTTLIIEEAEEVETFEEFSKVDESIRQADVPLKIILVYNPTSSISSWIHKEWFADGRPNKLRQDDTIFLHSTYLDNIENLNPSTVKRYQMLERTNPVYYINTILAEWTLEAEGRFYAGWGEYAHMNFDSPPDTWYGLDFGYGGKDKTSLIKIQFFENTYYVTEIFSEAKLKIKAILAKMREGRVPFNAVIYADSAMPLLITEIRDGGYRSTRKCQKGNVEAGIKKIQDKNIVIVGDSPNLYYSYMTFRRDKNNKLPHEPDELAALRYGINSRKPILNPGKRKARPARRRANKGFLMN